MVRFHRDQDGRFCLPHGMVQLPWAGTGWNARAAPPTFLPVCHKILVPAWPGFCVSLLMPNLKGKYLQLWTQKP